MKTVIIITTIMLLSACGHRPVSGHRGLSGSVPLITHSVSTNPQLPVTVITGTGTVLIVPNYGAGPSAVPSAIIPVSR